MWSLGCRVSKAIFLEQDFRLVLRDARAACGGIDRDDGLLGIVEIIYRKFVLVDLQCIFMCGRGRWCGWCWSDASILDSRCMHPWLYCERVRLSSNRRCLIGASACEDGLESIQGAPEAGPPTSSAFGSRLLRRVVLRSRRHGCYSMPDPFLPSRSSSREGGRRGTVVVNGMKAQIPGNR